WVSLNKNISQIDDNIWRIAPNNTNIAEAAHTLSNQHGKGYKLDKERFTAINIHQQYNIPKQGNSKGPISNNLLSNKRKAKAQTKRLNTTKPKTNKKKRNISTIKRQRTQKMVNESEDTNESNNEESSKSTS
ncbi:hypothetical protein C2G38_2051403, partial [Gigaspora rosea]